MRFLSAPAVLWLAAVPLTGETPVDTSVVTEIRDEGFNRSKVMETAAYLTDVIGPRLSGLAQPQEGQRVDPRPARVRGARATPISRAGALSAAAGRSSAARSASGLAPAVAPLIASPKAWTPGTYGPVRAKVVKARARDRGRPREDGRGSSQGHRAPDADARELKAPGQGSLQSLHRAGAARPEPLRGPRPAPRECRRGRPAHPVDREG